MLVSVPGSLQMFLKLVKPESWKLANISGLYGSSFSSGIITGQLTAAASSWKPLERNLDSQGNCVGKLRASWLIIYSFLPGVGVPPPPQLMFRSWHAALQPPFPSSLQPLIPFTAILPPYPSLSLASLRPLISSTATLPPYPSLSLASLRPLISSTAILPPYPSLSLASLRPLIPSTAILSPYSSLFLSSYPSLFPSSLQTRIPFIAIFTPFPSLFPSSLHPLIPSTAIFPLHHLPIIPSTSSLFLLILPMNLLFPL